MQPQEPAFKLKPFSFSSVEANNEEEKDGGPLSFRFGAETNEESSIASLFGACKPAAIREATVASAPPATTIAPVVVPQAPLPETALDGIQPSVHSGTKPIAALPLTEDAAIPKRTSGFFKNMQLSTVQGFVLLSTLLVTDPSDLARLLCQRSSALLLRSVKWSPPSRRWRPR